MPHPASQAVPILDVAQALGIELSGPRHAHCFNFANHKEEDTRPPFAFFLDTNTYYCFVCGVRGDSIDLVRAIRQVDFRSAVAWITDLAGGNLPAHVNAGQNLFVGVRTPDRAAFEVYETLYSLAHEIGPDTPAGLFLRDRHIDPKLANDNHVREIRDSQSLWHDLNKNFGLDRLRAAGLVSSTDRFLFARHSLLFFYFCGGGPVFVQVRDVTGELSPKELSLAGLHSRVPYNVDVIVTYPKDVFLCEGCVDTLSGLQMGVHAIGVPGVTGFREEWFEFFTDVDQVNLVFDNDDAGRQQATELRSQFRRRRIQADSYHPLGVKDLNELLKIRKEN